MLLLSCQNALAGWYHVENYEGSIGPAAVHFSIQTYDGFGSGISAEGSYFRDAERSPIAVYGTVTGSRLALCEIADDKEFDRIIVQGSKTPVDTTKCPFLLDIAEGGITGTWSKGADKRPVTLRKVASLDDAGEDKVEGSVTIPFWAQTARHMFVGVYANTGAGICMKKLRITDKRSGKLAQVIDFGKNDCDAGMLMTPIYMNVQKQTEKGVDTIFVNFRDGRAGYTQDYVWSPKAKKYRLTK